MTGRVLQEPDRLAGRGVAALLLAGLILSGGCAFLAWAVWSERLQRLEPAPPSPAQKAPTTIDGIEQTLFDASRAGQALREQQKVELGSWSWADRQRRLVRIPIGVAMELSAARGSRP